MKIIIAGAYAIGTYLAQFLSRNKYDIILIDELPENLEKIGQNYDLLTLEGKSTSINVLKQAGAKHADLFIAVNPKETDNITACTMLTTLVPKKQLQRLIILNIWSLKTKSFLNDWALIDLFILNYWRLKILLMG